jgi:threonine/homoserine/homoserine lactone efflux protein
MEGIVLAATNPVSIAFWVSATAGITGGHLGDRLPLALGGFLAGNLICAFVLAAGVSMIQRRTRPRFWGCVSRTCGVTLISLGALVGGTSL